MTGKKCAGTFNDLLGGEVPAQHSHLWIVTCMAERNLDGCRKLLLHYAAEEEAK